MLCNSCSAGELAVTFCHLAVCTHWAEHAEMGSSARPILQHCSRSNSTQLPASEGAQIRAGQHRNPASPFQEITAGHIAIRAVQERMGFKSISLSNRCTNTSKTEKDNRRGAVQHCPAASTLLALVLQPSELKNQTLSAAGSELPALQPGSSALQSRAVPGYAGGSTASRGCHVLPWWKMVRWSEGKAGQKGTQPETFAV